MRVFQREFLLSTLAACMALMTGCTSPGYNDNPSQQITNARVGCLAATDFVAVYFSVHVQPSDENEGAKMTKEIFRPYCNDIPMPGKVFFTADLVGNELKTIPIEIRLVEMDSGYEESRVENFRDARVMAEFPARVYSKGVIESQFELEGSGHYAVYLIRGGKDSVAEGDRLIIPLDVGIRSGTNLLMARIVPLFGAVSVLALVGIVAFWRMRKRKAL